jgi:hypothetical protein
MTTPRYDRPEPSEFAPAYANYIRQVPDGDLLATLERQLQDTRAALAGLTESQADFAYAPGKWTIKEVLGHVTDGERVFAYRALCFARGDSTPLPGFDEQAWTPASGASSRTLADLLEELAAVRDSTLALLSHLPADAPLRRGTANGNEISVRALAWIIAGHERHHLRILRERYLQPGAAR